MINTCLVGAHTITFLKHVAPCHCQTASTSFPVRFVLESRPWSLSHHQPVIVPQYQSGLTRHNLRMLTSQAMQHAINKQHAELGGWYEIRLKAFTTAVLDVVFARDVEGSLSRAKYVMPSLPAGSDPPPPPGPAPRNVPRPPPGPPPMHNIPPPAGAPPQSSRRNLEDTTRPAAPPNAVKDLDAVAADAGADPAAKKQAEQVKAKEKKIDRYAEAVLCLEMLNKVNWLSDMPNNDEYGEDLTTIFHEGMKYVKTFQHGTLLPWNLENWPLNPRVWLGEMERALACLAQRGILPKWLTSPHDRHIRQDACDAADGFPDPGNEVLDVLVHALRLWKYVTASKVELVIRQSTHEYGACRNRSSIGPVNLIGNIVEAMTHHLQRAGAEPSTDHGNAGTFPDYSYKSACSSQSTVSQHYWSAPRKQAWDWKSERWDHGDRSSAPHRTWYRTW